jgi:hypothetical protein
MWKIARHPTASRELTAAIGARTVDRVKWMTRPGRTAEDVAKAISGILTYPMKAVNEFNELHAAQTGVELAKDVRAGKNAASNSFRLELLGFSPEQAERMSQGRGTEKEYKAIATRFPLVTQGAGRGSAGSPAERSRAANSGLYQALVPFDSYAQMTANRTARLYSRWLSAMRSGTVPQKAAATKVLAQYHVGHALAGAGAAFIYAYLNGGTAGVKERAAEATDAPLGFIRDALLNSMVGGVAGRFVNSAQRPGPTKLGDIATSMSYPASLLQEGFDAVGGTGKYRDQTPLERAGTFLSGRLTASKAVATMMAAFGLGEDDTVWKRPPAATTAGAASRATSTRTPATSSPARAARSSAGTCAGPSERMKLADESGAQKEVAPRWACRTSRGRTSRSPSGAASSSTTSSPSSSTA